MTLLRILAASAAAAAIVALGAGALLPRAPESPPQAPSLAPASVSTTAVPTAPGAPAGRRERVPAGILTRAARARALDRAAACEPAQVQAGPACPPAERDAVDVEWEVGREP